MNNIMISNVILENVIFLITSAGKMTLKFGCVKFHNYVSALLQVS